jgi:hypothetical protein
MARCCSAFVALASGTELDTHAQKSHTIKCFRGTQSINISQSSHFTEKDGEVQCRPDQNYKVNTLEFHSQFPGQSSIYYAGLIYKAEGPNIQLILKAKKQGFSDFNVLINHPRSLLKMQILSHRSGVVLGSYMSNRCQGMLGCQFVDQASGSKARK